MPKKAPVDGHAKRDLGQHLSSVERSLFDLRFRLRHYFAAREDLRERLSAIENRFRDYATDCRREVDRRVKEKMPNKSP